MHLLTFNQFIPSVVHFDVKYWKFGGQLKGKDLTFNCHNIVMFAFGKSTVDMLHFLLIFKNWCCRGICPLLANYIEIWYHLYLYKLSRKISRPDCVETFIFLLSSVTLIHPFTMSGSCQSKKWILQFVIRCASNTNVSQLMILTIIPHVYSLYPVVSHSTEKKVGKEYTVKSSILWG